MARMEASESDREIAQRHSIAPNVFYDVIVFLTPTITFFVGVAIGCHPLVTQLITRASFSIDTPVVVLFGFVLFFGSYELGRVAETYSDAFVAGPIKFLHRRNVIFTSPDYGIDLSNQVGMIGIPEEFFFGRTKSKWTLLFFALEYLPHVGADLLKRYAWEKLARSSAFAIFCLFVLSLATYVYYCCKGLSGTAGAFGTIEFTSISFLMYILWAVDYYKRNCWNNDLLITTMPVIISAVRALPEGKALEARSQATHY